MKEVIFKTGSFSSSVTMTDTKMMSEKVNANAPPASVRGASRLIYIYNLLRQLFYLLADVRRMQDFDMGAKVKQKSK